jgi:GNAT superfamily N-acetyltransferase
MDFTCRPARPEGLQTAAGIVQQAYNDLRQRHGLAPTVPLRPPTFQNFCLAEDPGGLWVAEAGDTMLGFGCSWMRGRFWYLAQLFTRPTAQAKGVGQALLSKTLSQAERNGAGNRALITMAYNTASTGLYIRNGLYPREPLYRMAAPAAAVAAKGAPGGHAAVPIESWPDCGDWLGRIDAEVLGFRRESQHAFLLGTPAGRALRIERSGQPVGYAYVSAEGHVGPLAIAPGADAVAVVLAALHAALGVGTPRISLIVPGRAAPILGAVSALGFRIEEPFVLLSAQPFGDWQHYLPGNPGIM